tara:strand:- start:253 stop:456 length:204 start_codon:yes stop_codon:yes gene_type:complete
MNKLILNMIEQRLSVGAKKYGENIDVDDGRNWTVEALEELLDACVYIAAEILRLEKNKIKGELKEND